MRRARGFTLVELMITVVIVGILFAVGLPSYHAHVLRTNRTVAKSALAEIVSQQESWYVEHKGYATQLSRLGYAADTLYLSSSQVLSAASSDTALYQVTLAGNPASTTCPPGGAASRTGFTVVATPVNTQAEDSQCGKLCVTSLGTKLAGGSQKASCWKR